MAAVHPLGLRAVALNDVVLLAVFQVTEVLLATVTVVLALLAIQLIAFWALLELA